MPTLLVIDHEGTLQEELQASNLEGLRIVLARTIEEAFENYDRNPPDLVLLDLQVPGEDHLPTLSRFQEKDPHLPVIIIAKVTHSELAIDAITHGAFDFLNRPLDLDQLVHVIEQALRIRRITSVPVSVHVEESDPNNLDHFLGRSPAMVEVFKQIGKVAPQDVTVLLRGESGTGKELAARAIYHHSDRSRKRFMAVNCAALPDTLLESELFGHEKGAFTGATTRRIGKFEICHEGTLFLDEVGDMSPLVQSKVLRALQERQFERVGGNETISSDVRLIAATNQPLEELVEKGEFREDLYYRLKEITIQLPPLRERGDDLKLLIEYFLSRHSANLDREDLTGLSQPALESLLKYDWPGNVRELDNVLKQAVINASGPILIPENLPAEIQGIDPYSVPPGLQAISEPGASGAESAESTFDLIGFIEERLDADSEDLYAEAVTELELYLFQRVLEATDGNQSQAAKILGITRGKVRDRIQTFNISLDTKIILEETEDVSPKSPTPK